MTCERCHAPHDSLGLICGLCEADETERRIDDATMHQQKTMRESRIRR